MAIHTVHYHDEPDGMELVDIDYQCSRACMVATIAAETGQTVTESAGMMNLSDGGSISWGAWPGGAETDYAVYCSGCGDHLWDGLQDDQTDDENN